MKLVGTQCRELRRLNLTWCVSLTDESVISIAEGCNSLEYLSLHGVLGITDASLSALSRNVSKTLRTLDVQGCTNVRRRTKDDIRALLPKVTCFQVHS